jgi:hypothetical protein
MAGGIGMFFRICHKVNFNGARFHWVCWPIVMKLVNRSPWSSNERGVTWRFLHSPA